MRLSLSMCVLIVCISASCRRADRAAPTPSENAEPVSAPAPEPTPSPEPHWVPSASVPTRAQFAGKEVQNLVYWYRKSNRTCLPATCTGRVEIEVELQIAPDGSVASSRTVKGDPKIGACLVKLATKEPFPKSDAGGTFHIPFIFEC